MILKIILLVSLLKALQSTNAPFLCSSIYAGAIFVFGLMAKGFSLPLLIGVAIAFVLSSIYFWLLNAYEESGLVYWVILIGGFLIGLV